MKSQSSDFRHHKYLGTHKAKILDCQTSEGIKTLETGVHMKLKYSYSLQHRCLGINRSWSAMLQSSHNMIHLRKKKNCAMYKTLYFKGSSIKGKEI